MNGLIWFSIVLLLVSLAILRIAKRAVAVAHVHVVSLNRRLDELFRRCGEQAERSKALTDRLTDG